MPDIVNGMFGIDPEQMRLQRYQNVMNQGIQMAQLSPAERANASMFQAGAGLAELGARAAGFQTPEERLSALRQQVFSSVDQSNPDSFKQAAMALNQAGDAKGAAMMMQAASQAEQQAVELNYKKALTEKALREPKVIKTIEVGVEGKPDYRQKAQIMEDGSIQYVGEPYLAKSSGSGGGSVSGSQYDKFVDETGHVIMTTKADAARRKLTPAAFDVGATGAAGAGKALGKEQGVQLAAGYNSAKAATDNIQKIDSLITQLNKSDVITGPAASIRVGIEKAKVMAGGDPSKLTDTQIADIMMGSEVFPMIKTLGIGARGMDTPAEREFMRNVLTGTIDLNKDTLLKMAQIRRDIAQRTIEDWNKKVESGDADRFFSASGTKKQKIEIPKYEPPVDNNIKAMAVKAFKAYEPNMYEYRIGSNGTVQRRKK